MADVEYLSAKGCPDPRPCRLLDIDSQRLLNVTVDGVQSFVKQHGLAEFSDEEAARIFCFSTPRPGERTTYISELIDLTAVEYRSFDMCLEMWC